MDVLFWAAQVLNGLAIGTVLFLVASGLTLVLGVLGILNLAHGVFYMLGAFLLATVFAAGVPGWFPLGLAAAATGAAALGGVVERVALRPLYGRRPLYVLLATFALVLVCDDLVLLVWGKEHRSVPPPTPLGGALRLGTVSFPVYYVVLLAVGLAVWGGLWGLLYRTRLGRLVRALSTDREMVAALGVPVARSATTVYVLSAALAGLGGALAAPLRSISSGMGVEVVIQSFVIVVLGGMGSLGGALLGSVILGQFAALGILVMPRFALAIPYLVLVVVLVWRPWGLFGRRA